MQRIESRSVGTKGGGGPQETHGATDGVWADRERMNMLKTTAPTEGKRTIVAMVSASIISLVVWALIVVLNVH
jgi:hypothetical protein